MAQSAIRRVAMMRSPHGEVSDDSVVVEGPLQIICNGEPLAVTMRTPGDDEALALGLAISEGLCRPDAEIISTWRHCHQMADAAVVELMIAPDDVVRQPRERSQVANASCGICGTRSLADIAQPAGSVLMDMMCATTQVPQWFAALETTQHGFRHTGGSHAAALLNADHRLISAAEDVGRHNAVDKAIGLAWQAGALPQVRTLVVSGRVSFEIVSKAAQIGVQMLAAVSAPSSLAISTAEACGISLLGFCRGSRCTVYTHAQRFSDLAQRVIHE